MNIMGMWDAPTEIHEDTQILEELIEEARWVMNLKNKDDVMAEALNMVEKISKMEV